MIFRNFASHTCWQAFLCCIALIFVVDSVHATTPGAGVRARLLNAPVLRGQFEQEKHLQGFKNPLLSKGEFLLAQGRGVVWTTRTPFASILVLNKQGLSSRQADGSARSLAGPAASPALGMANTLLLALLSGDVTALARQFDLHETLSADGSWRLQLLPKQGVLKKIFKLIELQGDAHVRNVRLEEIRGDRTELRFLQVRDVPVALTADEAKQFE